MANVTESSLKIKKNNKFPFYFYIKKKLCHEKNIEHNMVEIYY